MLSFYPFVLPAMSLFVWRSMWRREIGWNVWRRKPVGSEVLSACSRDCRPPWLFSPLQLEPLLLSNPELPPILWPNEYIRNNWFNDFRVWNFIYITLENYQALLRWKFYSGKFLWEKATLQKTEYLILDTLSRGSKWHTGFGSVPLRCEGV